MPAFKNDPVVLHGDSAAITAFVVGLYPGEEIITDAADGVLMYLEMPSLKQPEFDALIAALVKQFVRTLPYRVSGIGAPNGVVLGSPGDMYVDTKGGANATLWVKESEVDTTFGWVAK
jgi:hypothetical protein